MQHKLQLLRQTAAICLFIVTTATALADIPRSKPPGDETLQSVLDRIHIHAIGDEWRKEGFKDDATEAWLDKLVDSIGKAAQMKDLKLPVRLADVKAADPARPRRPQGGELIVGKHLQLRGMLRNSIVFADGNVELDTIPQDCVIIARNVVHAKMITRGCVIVAGTYFKTRFDGEPANPANGSLIVTRGQADMETAYGSIIAAAGGANVRSAQDAVFVNSPISGRDRGGSKSIKVPNLSLGNLPTHPLIAKVTLLGVVQVAMPMAQGIAPPPFGQEPRATGVVFRFENRRYIADVGQPIVDEAGQPIDALRDWSVTFANERIAIFSKCGTDTVLSIESK